MLADSALAVFCSLLRSPAVSCGLAVSCSLLQSSAVSSGLLQPFALLRGCHPPEPHLHPATPAPLDHPDWRLRRTRESGGAGKVGARRAPR
eukprot:2491933-Alexandrium_andersonii.AAC.1